MMNDKKILLRLYLSKKSIFSVTKKKPKVEIEQVTELKIVSLILILDYLGIVSAFY